MSPILVELKKNLNSSSELKSFLFAKYICTYKEIGLVMIGYMLAVLLIHLFITDTNFVDKDTITIRLYAS